MRKLRDVLIVFMLILAMTFAGCGDAKPVKDSDSAKTKTEKAKDNDDADDEESDEDEEDEETEEIEIDEQTAAVLTALLRPLLIDEMPSINNENVEASVPAYTTDSSLSNVTNLSRFYLSDQAKKLISENLFVVSGYGNKEFFEIYESNRYNQLPSFVTVDSMMHTYHLYFAHLLKKIEKTSVYDMIETLSQKMYYTSIEQYNEITDEDWKEAAKRNVAFFGVACKIFDPECPVPAQVEDVVNSEVSRVYAAAGIEKSAINGGNIDYTQFIPRGYYAGDARLETYFRAMMWYGQMTFYEADDSLNRSAALMTMALEKDDNLENWESAYMITSFFAGASDDLTYYEYKPVLDEVYGADADIDAIEESEGDWEEFKSYTEKMDPPVINSVPMFNDAPTEENLNDNKGLRFMGQRFTIDAAIMEQLVYTSVGPNSAGEVRDLPKTLDVAAALGSNAAYEVLDSEGDTDFEGYTDNMAALREGLEKDDSTLWNASLYANWLYTLRPLLEEKKEGFPSFMLNKAWQLKDAETFAGSYTELKHDTVLYAKQIMVEMGGGDMATYDDRGYVEPEVAVWARFVNLSDKTRDGLVKYNVISDEDVENLNRLSELANGLLTISEKELRNETLTDAEYDLIRNYGGNLEHFWYDAVKEGATSDRITTRDFPAALVTDIASNSNGECLELGTGDASIMYVIVPVDGSLRICSGSVYDFYEFTWPSSDRLTDSSWRGMMGIELDASGNYNYDRPISKPEWTKGYREERK